MEVVFMMDKENLAVTHEKDSKVLSLQEFKDGILNYNDENATKIDKVSDLYDKVPDFIKKLTNFDPTGIASYFDGLLSDNKAKREQDRILTAMWGMYHAFIVCGNQLKEHIEQDKVQYSMLTELYLEKAKGSIQQDKIQYFTNIWINSIFNINREFNEKEYVFQLVSTFTLDQIEIIKVVYDGVKAKNINNIGQPLEDETDICISVKEISEKLDLGDIYIQQLCTDLYGRGIFRYPRGAFINSEPDHFLPTGVVELLNMYLSNQI